MIGNEVGPSPISGLVPHGCIAGPTRLPSPFCKQSSSGSGDGKRSVECFSHGLIKVLILATSTFIFSAARFAASTSAFFLASSNPLRVSSK